MLPFWTWIRKRHESSAGSSNIAESRNLLVQSVTVGLGGCFAFGLETTSGAAHAVGAIVVAINFFTLIPALKLVYVLAKRRWWPVEDVDERLLGGSE
jgi:hypothetical protein